MLSYVQREASDRKLRLLAVSCYGRLESVFSKASVEERAIFRAPLLVSERYADGDASPQELADTFSDLARVFGTPELPNMWRDIASDRKDRIAGTVVELW